MLPAAIDSDFKRNLAGARIANFLAIAWLVAHLVRHGVVKKLAARLPWIGAVGRDGMVCFVAGAVISLVVDSVLFTLTGGLIDVPLGLAADAVAISMLLAVPQLRRPLMHAITPKPALDPRSVR